ncbi:MAG: hypothetical protein IJE28_10715, partial [Oscillospiraceae bacterium]|nr:hypothetical protein [Oscillospiraceae bacterium]
GADMIRPFLIGWDYTPSVISFGNATSPQWEVNASAEGGETPHPSFSAKPKNPPSPQGEGYVLRESFFRADIIRPYGFLIILHFALCIVH